MDGLNVSTDNYLTKLFQMQELLARVKSLIRGNKTFIVKNICGNITLKREAMELSAEYASVLLSKREFNIYGSSFTKYK